MELKPQEVTEFQGLYGPFTVPEKLLQKIWLRGDFDETRAKTLEGEPVRILFPGKWNLLGGPDFRGARILIGEREVAGDIELHFNAADWARHRHHIDAAYDEVALHVLLFQPPPGAPPAQTAAGRALPALVLLDLLHHDLEEYAAEDALEATLERSHWQVTERLLLLPVEERRQLLVAHARRRWEQKVHFAGLRIRKLGWEEACHQAALEILGYRRNRSAMLNVANRFPCAAWRDRSPDVASLLAAGGRWHVQGTRPANHPRQRLHQYLRWMEKWPDWPRGLRPLIDGAGAGRVDVGDGAVVPLRKSLDLRRRREEWNATLTAGAVPGTRFDTLLGDGFFPLAAAAGSEDVFALWFAWYAGDFPDRVQQTLRATDVLDRRTFAACNGFGQGVLSLSLDQRNDPLSCFEPPRPEPVG